MISCVVDKRLAGDPGKDAAARPLVKFFPQLPNITWLSNLCPVVLPTSLKHERGGLNLFS